MSAEQVGQPPGDLMKLFLGFLKKGPSWSPESTPEIEANQRDHLALLSRLSDSGDLLLAGPTPESGDLRGILVCQADSLESAKALFLGDPHITSSRLILEMQPIYLSRSTISRPLLQDRREGT